MPRVVKTKYATEEELGEYYEPIMEEFDLGEGEELDDEVQEKVEEKRAEMQQQAQKTAEQIALEKKRAFQEFHYNPPVTVVDEDGDVVEIKPQKQWSAQVIYFLFVLCIICTVLTLDQWHGTHAWRLPFDVYPEDRRIGGWPQENHDYRFSGAIIGALGGGFSWVMKPTGDRFRCFTWMLMVGAILCFISFGNDFHRLEQAKDLPYCKGINDMKTRKVVCEFDEYRATVMFDIFCGILNVLLGLVYCYTAETGNVSRRTAYNPATSSFEKIIPDPDKGHTSAYPRAFRNGNSMRSGLSALTGICNLILVALSITQSAGSFAQPPGYSEPIYNGGYQWPVNVYLISSTDAFRYGSWPETNFDLRLGANILAVVLLSFLIQWQRTGRRAQLCVITLSIVAAIMYLGAFALDWMLLQSQVGGCPYEATKNQRCVFHRYYATVILEAFIGIILLVFNIRNLMQFVSQCKQPVERGHPGGGVSYGWWCNGEWDNEEDED